MVQKPHLRFSRRFTTITDDIVKQIGENDNPKIRGAMGFDHPLAPKRSWDMEAKTCPVFDPKAEQWHVYKSFETEG